MTIYKEQFYVDANWQAAGGWVDSTKIISGGLLTLTAVTDYSTSLWTRTGFSGLDCIVVAKTSTSGGNPQIHVRETDADNFLTAYIDSSGGNFVIAKRVSGTLTTLSTEAITDFSTANNYTIIVKVFGNALHAILLGPDDKTINHLIEVSSDVSDQTGVLAGVGCGAVAVYQSVDLRTVKIMTTLVCLGDSNTNGNNIPQADEFPEVMNARRRFDNIVCVNSGKAGDNIAECEARIATEVTPYFVAGHRNACVMQMGTNDRADGFTAAQSWVRYQSCIATVKAAGFEAYVNNGFPNTKADAANTQWNEDLNADIMADEATYGYTAIDVWTPFGGTIGSGFPYSVALLWVTANNPHASAEGHLIFAREVLEKVKNNSRALSSARTQSSARTLSSRSLIAQDRLINS